MSIKFTHGGGRQDSALGQNGGKPVWLRVLTPFVVLVSYLLFIVAGSYCLLSSVEPNTALALQENLGVMWTIGTPLFFSCLLGAAALTFLLRAAANKALKYSMFSKIRL